MKLAIHAPLATLFVSASALASFGVPQKEPNPQGPSTQDPGAAEPTNGRLLVLNKSEATLWVVDGEAGHRIDQLKTGVGPHEVAVSPDGLTAVIADYGQETPGNTLTVMPLTGWVSGRKIDLGEHTRPHGIEFEDDRHVIVTAETSQAILRVDIVEGRVTDVMPTNQTASHMLVLSPDRSRAYVANIGSGSVTAIDLESGEILAQIPTGAGCEGIDVTPDGAWVWTSNRAADTVSIIDTEALETVDSIPCPDFPIRVKITPDGAHALVSGAQSGDVTVFDVERWEVVTRIPMAIQATETDKDGRLFGDQFGGSPVPVGVLIRPDGERAYVANTNADILTEIDLSTWKIVRRIETGKEPDGLAWSDEAYAPAK